KKTRAFSELQSHYLFAEKFGRPAKGNDKGKVEGIVGYARRNFMVPIPRAGRKRRLENVWRGTGRRFFRCRAARMKPARSNRRESVRCRWCVIARMITRRRPSTGTAMCW